MSEAKIDLPELPKKQQFPDRANEVSNVRRYCSVAILPNYLGFYSMPSKISSSPLYMQQTKMPRPKKQATV
ncbi:MAG: hypothetical protein L6R41_003913 [Letrouitia leprolyta]|nr:MAG: hypothetical protein L6R41_003913 [Letrouitia leprolyta]